ncbi:MAG: 50S ribosomal protein L1 [Candidatus Paraimprobicoccus trichonymphae]|uniref:Large ribosomal subunit protein uL1 n=1 Tax=Candidatus Paraimprobicoccus trichonymphae TaxID=3033793 RepID=A0AA48HW41_9FIRM|nr:MAG: 50S ribosomal protein L1 [Candidatus Paraimprobicoccus trichonymphae]
MKHGKKYLESAKLYNKLDLFEMKEALGLCIKSAKAKFDETVEMHIKLGVDSRHADQQVRGAVILPHGTGKKIRILAVCKGENEELARSAGANFIGSEDIISKIQNQNWLDFDVMITTPDMMPLVGKLGKILGPRGLMPNPKAGTVSTDISRAIKDTKAGKIEYRLDKTNIIHCPVGKVSFGVDKLFENSDVLLNAVLRSKPESSKGQYVKSCVISSTMGVGIKINHNKLIAV